MPYPPTIGMLASLAAQQVVSGDYPTVRDALMSAQNKGDAIEVTVKSSSTSYPDPRMTITSSGVYLLEDTRA